MVARNTIEKLLELWLDDVNAGPTMLTGGVVMVWREDFAELNLAFEAVPDSIHDT